MPKRSKVSVDGSTASLSWHKSTASANNADNCLEAALSHESVLVRDTKNRAGPSLAFPLDTWSTFVGRLH